MLSGAEVNEGEALKQAAADFIAAVPAWPPGGAAVVKQRLATVGAAPDHGCRCARTDAADAMRTGRDSEGNGDACRR